MKRIKDYISEKLYHQEIDEKLYHQEIDEKLIVNNTIKDNSYKYHPKTKDELIDCINNKIKKEGLGTKDKPLDLNDINTSEITDMSNLFNATDGYLIELSKNGQFDISNWNVSNVKNMRKMFYCSNFNGDISNWNIKNVEDMYCMFVSSKFNGNINKWDISNVKELWGIFMDSPHAKNPPKWHIRNM